MTLFILHLIFYSFFIYSEDEGREGMIVVVCEERETIKKRKRKIDILIKCSIK